MTERLGLATRLTASYLAILALVLIVLSLFLHVALGRAIEENAFALLRREAVDARLFLSPLVVKGVPLDRAGGVVEVAKAPGVGIAVIEPNGRVAIRSAAARAAAPLPEPSPDALEALRGGQAEWRRIVEVREVIDDQPASGRTAVLMVPLRQPPQPPPARIQPLSPPDAASRAGNPPAAGPLVDRFWSKPLPAEVPLEGDVVGFVQVSMPMDALDATLQTVRLLLAGGVGATLLIALVVGLPLTRIGLRPLRAVAGASRRLAEGDLSVRVAPPTSRDEVGDLAHAFNEMAERLEAAFATQRAFVADASHELRTPLTALGGQLDVFLRAAREHPAEAEQLARTMRGEVNRMTRLVEELLTLARLDDRGAAALQLGRVDLGAVARDVYEEARALPAARDKKVHLDGEAAIVVSGDAARLHQVLLNLTVNALQHTPASEAIWLSLERRNGRALAVVRDSGPGIPTEHLPHVFDRFYRADGARARETADGREVASGAGLGLAIAQAIAQAHGGTLTAANARTGGAVFTLTLPADRTA
ncbi:MAG TPA: HAMP domain-containing sensor histidine kinase [Chloroflexota bacterium]|jgi:two-component system OmpR family sensor kinase